MAGQELFQSPWSFLGLPEDVASPAHSRGWLLPIPYESTTSYGAGAREGPAAILAASRQVELYDQEFCCESAMDYGIHTTLPLGLVHRSPEAMVRAVEETVAKILSGSPRPELLGVLGGEHTISAGVVRELLRRVFSVDVLKCDRCGGHMRILCATNPPGAIQKILDCLGLPSKPPPIAPAELEQDSDELQFS
jgi:agmatinase